MDEELEMEHKGQYTYHFFFAHGVYEQLKDIEDFTNSTDNFLKTNLTINKGIADSSINPRFHPEVQFEFIFPDILWRTTFLHSYFLLESSLDQVCKNLQEVENYSLNLSDIAGGGIIRASTYLKKVAGIEMPFKSQYWSRLTDYNKLRNIFVHGDGLVSRKVGIELAKRNEGLLIAIIDMDKMALRFSKDFIFNTIQTIENFFRQLQTAMQQKRSVV